MVCPCCVPANPCIINVDGVPVDIQAVDPATFLDISWNGAAVPDGTDTFIRDDVVEYSIPTAWFWKVFTIDTGFSQVYEYTSKFLQGGSQRWQFPLPDGHGMAPLFAAQAVSATECLLYGYCQTYQDFVPGRNIGDPPNCVMFSYSSLWRWEAMLTGGVVGGVTLIPIKGYKSTYVEDEDGNCQIVNNEAASYGPTPTVTLTFAP